VSAWDARYARLVTRIIAGFAGSLRLDVPKTGTRPTSDRVREAVFSALEALDALEGASVLDLYAGSGALALEAISRGASSAVCVEHNQNAARVAASNVKKIVDATNGLGSERIRVVTRKVESFLSGAGEEFDLVFIDPPYEHSQNALAATLAAVVNYTTAGAVIVVERSSRSPEPIWPSQIAPLRHKRFGETVIWFAERA